MTFVFKNKSKEENMKIEYANELIINMELGDPTTCIYQFIFVENDRNDTNILQYFIMHGLGWREK